MRVLHLAAGNLFGGVETYLLTLARLRHFCPEIEPQFGVCFPGRLREELAAAGVSIHDLGTVRVSRPWTVMRGRQRLRNAIRNEGIEAVITHGCWPHAIFASAVRSTGVRLLNCTHGELGGRHWIERWAARTPPDAVIANSRHTAATVDSVFPGVPIDVSYLPVAGPDITDREATRRVVRAESGTPDAAVVVLQASRLEPWKGQTVLVEALAQLRDVSGWHAWIAGGPQKSGEDEFLGGLKAKAAELGIEDRVRFLGQRSDVQRLMSAADIYCQPNTGPEPFGIAFIEALYSSLPVVTSDFGGAIEIVNEACGVRCSPNDVGAVAMALRSLITDSTRRGLLSKGGPERARRTVRTPTTDDGARQRDLVCGRGSRVSCTVEERALRSGGTSAAAIYRMVAATLTDRHTGGGVLLDVGCGRGEMWQHVSRCFASYIGADVVRHGGFPEGVEFHRIDLDAGRVPLPEASADVVAAVETIEHLENPRAFARELTRLAKPGGWIVVTTPNQLSLLSKFTLVLKNEFNAFRASSYPAHLTALLQVDLYRIARECGWVDVTVAYSNSGRIPGVRWHWPRWLSRCFPRSFSDNVLVIGRKAIE